MTIKQFVFNAFSENTFIVYDETKECIIIDPGCYDQSEKDTLEEFVKENNLKVISLINTHCHIDHVLGNSFVKSEYDVDLIIHELDMSTLNPMKLLHQCMDSTHMRTVRQMDLLEKENR